MLDLLKNLAEVSSKVKCDDIIVSSEVYLRRETIIFCLVEGVETRVRLRPEVLITKEHQGLSLEVTILVKNQVYWMENFRDSKEMSAICEALEPLFARAESDDKKERAELFEVIKRTTKGKNETK